MHLETRVERHAGSAEFFLKDSIEPVILRHGTTESFGNFQPQEIGLTSGMPRVTGDFAFGDKVFIARRKGALHKSLGGLSERLVIFVIDRANHRGLLRRGIHSKALPWGT